MDKHPYENLIPVIQNTNILDLIKDHILISCFLSDMLQYTGCPLMVYPISSIPAKV